jgi:hypothetical protein
VIGARAPQALRSGHVNHLRSRQQACRIRPSEPPSEDDPQPCRPGTPPPDSVEPLGRDQRFVYMAMRQVDLGTTSASGKSEAQSATVLEGPPPRTLLRAERSAPHPAPRFIA